jgi:general secretion pathway protein M
MRVQLTPVQSKLLAGGLVVLFLLILVLAISLPLWLLHGRYDSSISDSLDKLERYRRISVLRPEIEKVTLDVSNQNPKQYYLKETTHNLAEAELQSLVTRLAESQNCRIISSQVLPYKEDPKAAEPGKILLSIQLSASIIPLQMLLHTLETQKPYLFIEQLSIRSPHGRSYKSAPGVQPEFQVKLTVAGFMSQPGDAR